MVLTIQQKKWHGVCARCHVSRSVWICAWDSDYPSTAATTWAALCGVCIDAETKAVQRIADAIIDERSMPYFNPAALMRQALGLAKLKTM